MDRWSIYIDIEGFSARWEQDDNVLWSLGKLMEGIFRIGHNVYPHDPDRLFAHQFGDGFVVISDFHEEALERCVTIAVALMRHVAASGYPARNACFARAIITEGEMSDIMSCYPSEVLDHRDNGSDFTISMKMGLMTVIPVMGTALIRAVSLNKNAPKGPLLLVESSKKERLGQIVPYQPIPDSKLLSIDWVHMNSPLLSMIQKSSPLASPAPTILEERLATYCEREDVPSAWRANVNEFLF